MFPVNTIAVEIKQVYGRDTIYPVCNKAKQFALIAGTKSLTTTIINHIKSLGFTVINCTYGANVEM